MRKRIIDCVPTTAFSPNHEWLDLEGLAEVEITSEHAAHPIESALLPVGLRVAGRRARKTDDPHSLCAPAAATADLDEFSEAETERTQEYVLRWSPDSGQTFHEIVRQQWNFSPHGTTNETEDHHVDLPAVTVLELSIIPDISRGDAFASLAQLRLA